jgi:hypothetical protein
VSRLARLIYRIRMGIAMSLFALVNWLDDLERQQPGR